MRRAALLVVIMFLASGLATVVTSDVGWDNPLAIFMTHEQKDEDPGFGAFAATVAILAMVPAVWWRRRMSRA